MCGEVIASVKSPPKGVEVVVVVACWQSILAIDPLSLCLSLCLSLSLDLPMRQLLCRSFLFLVPFSLVPFFFGLPAVCVLFRFRPSSSALFPFGLRSAYAYRVLSNTRSHCRSNGRAAGIGDRPEKNTGSRAGERSRHGKPPVGSCSVVGGSRWA